MTCLTSAFSRVTEDISKMILNMLARTVAAFPIRQPDAAQGICILIRERLQSVAGCNWSVRNGLCSSLRLREISWRPTSEARLGYYQQQLEKPRTDFGKNKDERPLSLSHSYYLFLPVSHTCDSPTHPFLPTKTQKSGISHFSSLSLLTRGVRNIRRSTPPPDSSREDTLLWVHLAMNFYSALPEAKWSFSEAQKYWSPDIFRCHDISNK